MQNASTVATTTLDDLVEQTIEQMAAAAEAAAQAEQNNISVFPDAAAYDAELQSILANKYTLQQNYHKRHGSSCRDTLSPFNRAPIYIDQGVNIPGRWGFVPEHDTGKTPLNTFQN